MGTIPSISTPPLDSTLSISGKAADAKVVGDKINLINGKINNLNFLDNVYPIGSIYMSINSTNPNNLFGGTWEQINNCFLLAQGSEFAAGSSGGEKNHTLSAAEMPSHNHGIYSGYGDGSNNTDAYRYQFWASAAQGWHESGQLATSYRGSGQAHNNMPPYLAVYIWKRVS